LNNFYKILSGKFHIPSAEPNITEDDAKAAYNAIKEGRLSSGSYVKKFEQEFANYIGTKFAIAVNSATSGLQLSLASLGIYDGEVITTPFTYAATSNVIVHQNAKPVFVDVDKTTYNIDPDKIEKAITKKTRAIMPIHYGGQCSEMEEISEIASKHNLFVIEDAAPAIGATHKQRKAGTFGIISAFSFFPDKNLTTGEGGMVVTSDPELADKCEELRKNGASSRYHHTSIGWNFKMPDPNAALGLSQLKRIESVIATKNKIAKYYQVSLEKINGIQPPIVKEYNLHTFMLYSILTKDLKQREEIKNALADKGIESRINFPSVHLQPIYKQMFGFQSDSFPISENLSDRILGLPIFFSMKEEQQDQIVNVIREIVK
jgi:perosamine synthetase